MKFIQPIEMKLLDLPDDILKLIIQKIQDLKDFELYKKTFFALQSCKNYFDTTIIKQKVIEIQINDENVIYLFNGYTINDKENNLYHFLYYDKEVVGINYITDRNIININYTIFKENYFNNFELTFICPSIGSKYNNYIKEYEIVKNVQTQIRKDKLMIQKKYNNIGQVISFCY